MALSYSWIHNQWGDLTLQAAGGGGGGGGGSGGAFGDPMAPEYFPGGSGGTGGRGEAASGSVVSTQMSWIDVLARWDIGPQWMGDPPDPPTAYDCNILLDIGWISAPNPDWTNNTNPIWARNINLLITAGFTNVQVIGGPTGPITVFATDMFGNPFFKVSSDDLESDIGSFGLGAGEVGVTIILPGETARINTPPNQPISSQLTGNMRADEGWGGEGGGGGIETFGLSGADGVNGGPIPGTAEGGEGGSGGTDDLIDLDGDMIPETPIGGGGKGGDGGVGGVIDEHKDGIFQGVVVIEVEEPH